MFTEKQKEMTIEKARQIGRDNACMAYDVRLERDHRGIDDAAAAYAVNVIDSINERVDTDDMQMKESRRLHLYRLRQAGLNAFDELMGTLKVKALEERVKALEKALAEKEEEEGPPCLQEPYGIEFREGQIGQGIGSLPSVPYSERVKGVDF